ncbi:dUTP diphosphatase [Cytobacillus horneckiae]|uniref:dUTP diphosphatase n=1 Tax=Cytobacillus horneckiae TaxID=549687 RepID=UPI003D9A7DF2
MLEFKGMYEAQKAFRSRIDYKGSDRFEKLILSLQVELGECANEWRGFKFWSENQESITSKNTCEHCNRYGMKSCCGCEGKLYVNPLLEEYSDGLHFILDLGIEIYFEDFEMIYRLSSKDKDKSVSSQFNRIFSLVARFNWNKSPITYIELISEYLILGELLGFSFEQIEEAYYQKNAVNHSRQNEGY